MHGRHPYFGTSKTPRRTPFGQEVPNSADTPDVFNNSKKLDDRNFQPAYRTTHGYRYNKQPIPAFNGNETAFMGWSQSMITWLRLKGIPNHFEQYLIERELPHDLDPEHRAADREIFDNFDAALTGTAKDHRTKQLGSSSGHLVWEDLVDTFIPGTGARRTALNAELNNFRWLGPRDESLPQMFKRYNEMVMKYRLCGGTTDDRQLVADLGIICGAHARCYSNVKQCLELKTPYEFQSKLLSLTALDKTMLDKGLAGRAPPPKKCTVLHCIHIYPHLYEDSCQVEAEGLRLSRCT